jgi:ketosteroid isomerase-like protein
VSITAPRETLATPASRRLATVADFVDALNAADLAAATACFLRDAYLVTPDDTAVHGLGAVREILAQLIARRARFEVTASAAPAPGVVRQCWLVRCGGVGGTRLEQVLDPLFVLRLIEGEWKLASAALRFADHRRKVGGPVL